MFEDLDIDTQEDIDIELKKICPLNELGAFKQWIENNNWRPYDSTERWINTKVLANVKSLYTFFKFES